MNIPAVEQGGFHTPSVVTKQLKLNQVNDGRRRVRISSNFIDLMLSLIHI